MNYRVGMYKRTTRNRIYFGVDDVRLADSWRETNNYRPKRK